MIHVFHADWHDEAKNASVGFRHADWPEEAGAMCLAIEHDAFFRIGEELGLDLEDPRYQEKVIEHCLKNYHVEHPDHQGLIGAAADKGVTFSDEARQGCRKTKVTKQHHQRYKARLQAREGRGDIEHHGLRPDSVRRVRIRPR
jgi:hypothetical protein